MDTPRRVCFYIRVSTDKQTTDNQLRDLLAYCQARRWPEPGPASIFRDVFSGGKDHRPQLDTMMNLIKKGRFDCLLVWNFDRFARSSLHAMLALNEFHNLGVDFVSHQQGIDTTTPIGKAMFTITAAFAELELAQIRERVNAGIRRARAEGKRLGRGAWKKTSTMRGPALISASVRARVLELRGSAPQRAIATLAGCSQGTVQRVLNLKPPPINGPSHPRSSVESSSDSQTDV